MVAYCNLKGIVVKLLIKTQALPQMVVPVFMLYVIMMQTRHG